MNDLTPKTIENPSAFEMKPRTLEEAMRFCEIMASSDLVPNAYKGKPGNILCAIQMGHELGMTPMRALRSIAVINGRASMWGDDVLAMVLASPLCEYVNESDSSDTEGVCRVKRKGCPEHVERFTLADAKRAGLLNKQGTWQTHQPRMLKMRARGFGLRDQFADVLAGLIPAEEALDLQAPEVEVNMEVPLTLKEKLQQQLATPSEPTQEAPPTTASHEAGTPSVHQHTVTVEPPAPSQPSHLLADLSIAVREAITEQELIRLTTHATSLSKPDMATFLAIVKERRKQMRGK